MNLLTMTRNRGVDENEIPLKCAACGRTLMAPVPWCPECGNRTGPAGQENLDEPPAETRERRNPGIVETQMAEPRHQVETGDWQRVMACSRPVGPTVRALLENHGIPFVTKDQAPAPGGAGQALFPEIWVRPEDLARAGRILRDAGLFEP